MITHEVSQDSPSPQSLSQSLSQSSAMKPRWVWRVRTGGVTTAGPLSGPYSGPGKSVTTPAGRQGPPPRPLPGPGPRYHCSDCQGPHRHVIPSRLLYNWDAAPRPVSRAAHTFLAHIAAKPLVNISTFNPSLAKIAPCLEEAARLRKQLTYLVAYLAACTRAQVRPEGRVGQTDEVCA